MKKELKKIIAREFLIAIAVFILSAITFLSIYPYNWFKSKQINSISESINLQDKILDSLSNSYKKKSDNQDWLYNQFKERFEESVKAAYNADKSENKFDLTFFSCVVHYIAISKVVPKHYDKTKTDAEIFDEVAKEYFNKPKIQFATDFWGSLYNIYCNKVPISWDKSWSKELIDFFVESGFKTPNDLSNFIKTNTIYTTETELKDSTQKQKDIAVEKKNTINNSMLSVDDQKEFALKGLLIFFITLFPLRYLYYGIKWSLSTLKN